MTPLDFNPPAPLSHLPFANLWNTFGIRLYLSPVPALRVTPSAGFASPGQSCDQRLVLVAL